jgi:peptidyl-prolyl cis-trans isomerase C
MRRPKLSPHLLAAGLGLLVAAWEGRPVHADTSPDQTAVVARVGAQTITAGDLSRRMAGIPPFQLRSFGSTGEEVRKNFLQKVLVREALLAQGAAGSALAARNDVTERTRAVLRNAMLTRLRAEVARNGKPTDEDIKAYYDKNAARFHSPAKLALWQILVQKREEAADILAELRKDPSPKRWADLARERSLDKATFMRGGNLGFVSPDGTTAEPGVRVDKTVLEAAAGVKDAEFVPEPVKVGDRWAVVWRRQSMKPVERGLDMEAPSIRQVLMHERTDARIKETIARLRKEHLADHEPELVEQIEMGASGELGTVRRPGTQNHARRSGNPAPIQVPGGLR